jgi:hypothetical protein
MQYLSLPQWAIVINFFSVVIYCHYMVIALIILLYDLEWQQYRRRAVNYDGKKFHNISLWRQKSLPIFFLCLTEKQNLIENKMERFSARAKIWLPDWHPHHCRPTHNQRKSDKFMIWSWYSSRDHLTELKLNFTHFALML